MLRRITLENNGKRLSARAGLIDAPESSGAQQRK
mgnify:CR=1 FL=1